jgi:hypothetical protein
MCVHEREVREVAALASVPAGRRSLEAPRILIEHGQAQGQFVCDRDSRAHRLGG